MLGDTTPYHGWPFSTRAHTLSACPSATSMYCAIDVGIEQTLRLLDALGEIAMKTQSDCISHAPRKAVTRALLVGAWVVAGMLSTAAIADDNQDEGEQHNGAVVRTVEGPVRGIVKIEASTRTEVHEFLGIPYAAPPVGK